MAGTSHDLVLDSDVHQLGTRVRDTDAHGYVARCLHSLPRWTCKFAMDDGSQVQPVAMAAFVGEEVTSNACSKKTKCGRHPDKPDMFACTACPRRTRKFAMDDSSQVQPVAMAAFVGEEVTSNACSKKTKCGRHPDKPDMFACAACPPTLQVCHDGSEVQPSAVAVSVGEDVASNARQANTGPTSRQANQVCWRRLRAPKPQVCHGGWFERSATKCYGSLCWGGTTVKFLFVATKHCGRSCACTELLSCIVVDFWYFSFCSPSCPVQRKDWTSKSRRTGRVD